MTVTRRCEICKVERTIQLSEVLGKGKKRVLCGHCSTVLIGEKELDDLYWRYYGGC
jgi:hypothetical protein